MRNSYLEYLGLNLSNKFQIETCTQGGANNLFRAQNSCQFPNTLPSNEFICTLLGVQIKLSRSYRPIQIINDMYDFCLCDKHCELYFRISNHL